MSRTVAYPRNAAVLTFTTFEASDGDFAYDDFQDRLDDTFYELSKYYRSLRKVSKWQGEFHIIAENRHAFIGVSEYCGLVSVYILPSSPNSALAKNWCLKAEKNFLQAVEDVWGQRLRQLGIFSNGEGVYEAIPMKEVPEPSVNEEAGWLTHQDQSTLC